MPSNGNRAPDGAARRLVRWLVAPRVSKVELLYPVAWMGVIYGLSSVSYPMLHSLGFAQLVRDFHSYYNLIHIPLFGFLALLWCRALRGWPLQPWAIAAAASLLTIGYGLVDESYQALVPGRRATSGDLLLDVVGTAVAVGFYLYLDFRARRTPGTREDRSPDPPY